jgi:hypothetical protein
MGWLFAVALGLHRQDRRIVWLALVPIALGHAVSVAAVALVFLWLGWFVDGWSFRAGTGLVLIGWALYHWRFSHRHRVRFGMQVGLAGLFMWSFLMAAAHGAGLMLWPALMPLCLPSGAGERSVGGRARRYWRTYAGDAVRHGGDRGHGLRVGRTRGPAESLTEHRRALGNGAFGDGHADALEHILRRCCNHIGRACRVAAQGTNAKRHDVRYAVVIGE